MIRKKCRYGGCPETTTNQSGYCDKHQAMLIRDRKRIHYAHEPEARKRDERSAYKRGYDHAWTEFAKKFLEDHPTCAICGKPATVCDHKAIPAQIMMEMDGKFDLSPDLYQALCTSCNNKKRKLDQIRIKQFQSESETLEDDIQW
jgi:hypothetical protein